jgi:hypothetical protein
MIIKTICFAYLGVLLFMPMTAVAVSGWTDYVPVEELTPTTHGRFLVKLKVSENPSSCQNKEIFYKDIYSPGSDQMFHALLEAVASGKKVRVYVTGKCELNGYSEISSVSIVP